MKFSSKFIAFKHEKSKKFQLKILHFLSYSMVTQVIFSEKKKNFTEKKANFEFKLLLFLLMKALFLVSDKLMLKYKRRVVTFS